MFCSYFLFAQEQITNADSAVVDTSIYQSDSLLTDSLVPEQRDAKMDNVINYDAQDSIYFDIKSQMMYLYGDAHVDYGGRQLDADLITINWGTSLVKATYSRDSVGKKVGVPLFDDNGDQYNADTILYNFETEKGYISGILTEQSDGFMRGGEAYKDGNNVIYVRGGEYCPCEDPNAGTYFRANKIKVVPEERVYTGPGVMYIGDIPTPLLLPFGLFPASDRKTSGIVPPTFGESATRGFYLRDMGFYWAVNDYIGTTFRGEYYSRGGGGLSNFTQYKKRYKYNGDMALMYRRVIEDADSYTEALATDYSIRWKHQPVSYGGKSFSADVNFETTTYSSRNELDLDRNIRSDVRSNINYSTPIRKTPFSTDINLRHEQNNQSGIINFNLPDVSLSMNQVKPFASSNSVGSKTELRKLYESISVRYAGNFSNKYTNDFDASETFGFEVANAREDTVLPFKGPNMSDIFANANYGITHRIPISASMKLGPVNMNPSFNYTENWYPHKYSYAYSQRDSAVVVDTVGGFGRAYNYSTGVSFDTRMYGMYSYRGDKQAKLRHTVNPSVGFSYSPETYDNPEVYQLVQTNENGAERRVSRYQGNVMGTPGGREAASINFGVRNDFEMKYLPKDDSTGKFKYLKILENLSASSSYNMIADSFNLSNLRFGANSSIIKNINIRTSLDVDPYTYFADSTNGQGEIITQTKINEYAWTNGQGLGHLRNFNINLGGSFSPETFRRKKKTEEESSAERSERYRNPERYVDFTVPWKFGFNYNYNIDKVGLLDPNKRQSLSFNGELKISEFWKVDMSVAYDLDTKKWISPRVNIYRDLNCWELFIRWVPFGPSQMYEFRIALKSPALKDIKLTRQKNIIDY